VRLSNRRFIGLDGGGSKTLCVTGDAEGRLTSINRGASSNLKSKSWQEVRDVLADMLAGAMAQIGREDGELCAIFLGMAGSDRPEDRDRIVRFLKDRLPSTADIVVRSDALSALASGTWGEAGAILIAGTGSIATCYDPDTEAYARVGGWGYLLGDEGSGFHIGRRGLVSVLRHYDGRGRSTVLSDKIMAMFGLQEPPQLVTFIYENAETRKTIADASRAVLECAEAGDAVAQEIVDDAIGELALLVATLLVKEGPSPGTQRLVLAGGLFDSDWFYRRFVELAGVRLRGYAPVRPAVPPVVGSYLLALRRAGVAVAPQLREAVAASWTALNGNNDE